LLLHAENDQNRASSPENRTAGSRHVAVPFPLPKWDETCKKKVSSQNGESLEFEFFNGPRPHPKISRFFHPIFILISPLNVLFSIHMGLEVLDGYREKSRILI
ncbi:hypothetical protein AABB24_020133, partial [Solanum stoloniferum]